jgi:hypothetical protein
LANAVGYFFTPGVAGANAISVNPKMVATLLQGMAQRPHKGFVTARVGNKNIGHGA